MIPPPPLLPPLFSPLLKPPSRNGNNDDDNKEGVSNFFLLPAVFVFIASVFWLNLYFYVFWPAWAPPQANFWMEALGVDLDIPHLDHPLFVKSLVIK